MAKKSAANVGQASRLSPKSEKHETGGMTGSIYYHCDWHASHYVKVMRIFGENNFTAAMRRN